MSTTVDDPGHAGPFGIPIRWMATIVVCLAQFMVILDATITNVALPSIQEDLAISPADLQWIVNSYTLAFGGLLLLGGRASDLLGRRKVFVLGTVLFSGASLMNGLAWNAETLIFFRGVQGVGAALVSPAALSVIMTSFAEGPERSKALSVWSGIAASGAAFGLLLGGVLTELVSWEWIFFINVPIGFLVVGLALRHVPESHADLGHRRFDLAGAISVTAGLMLLVYTIVGTLDHGFTSARTLTLAAISLALLATFIVIELRSAAPLVRLALFRIRSLALANVAMLVVAAGMFSFFFFVMLYLQQVLGFDPIEAGLSFLPFTVGIGIGAGFSQAMVKRIGVKAVGIVGLVLSSVGLVYIANVMALDGTYLELLVGMVPLSIGMGATFVPFTLIATTNVEDDEAGLASGVFNTSQQIGGALGLAILSTVANDTTEEALRKLRAAPAPQQQLQALLDGFSMAIYWGAGLVLVALAVHIVFLRRSDVANVDVSAAPVVG